MLTGEQSPDSGIVEAGETIKLGVYDQMGIKIENVFDVAWNETQFATESRLMNEPESVEEIHFTPGTPFFLKGSLAYRF